MQVFIKTLTGKTISFNDVTSNNTVTELKDKISESEGIPNNEQRLIFHGKELVDDKTLEDSSVEEGSTIHLVLRLRGGK